MLLQLDGAVTRGTGPGPDAWRPDGTRPSNRPRDLTRPLRCGHALEEPDP